MGQPDLFSQGSKADAIRRRLKESGQAKAFSIHENKLEVYKVLVQQKK